MNASKQGPSGSGSEGRGGAPARAADERRAAETTGRLAAPEGVLGRATERPGPVPVRAVRVEKPWGYEIIWAHTDLYAGKTLHVRAGESLSLQFHEEKDETLFLQSGELRVRVGPGLDSLEDVELRPGESLRIEPGTLHWMEARTDVVLLEASTPELDDVIRVRDRYGRAPDPDAGNGTG